MAAIYLIFRKLLVYCINLRLIRKGLKFKVMFSKLIRVCTNDRDLKDPKAEHKTLTNHKIKV